MTEKKDFPVFRVGIVTLSDKGYQGEREDKSERLFHFEKSPFHSFFLFCPLRAASGRAV